MPSKRTAAPDLAPPDISTPDLFAQAAASPPVPTETGDEQQAEAPAVEPAADGIQPGDAGTVTMNLESGAQAARADATTADEPEPADEPQVADVVQEFVVVPAGPAPAVTSAPGFIWDSENVEVMLRHATPGLLGGIVQVMQRLKTLKTDATNEHSNYKYASIDAYMAALRPAIAEAGLVILQDLETQSVKDGQLTAGWRFFVLHVSGGYIGPVSFESSAAKSLGAQAYGACQAYGLKFFMRMLFQVAATERGEDIDQQRATPLPDGVGTRTERRAPQQQNRGQAPRYQPGQAPASWQGHQAPPPDDTDIPGYKPGPPDGPAPQQQRQEPKPRPFAQDWEKLKKRVQDAGLPIAPVMARFKVDDLSKLTPAQLQEGNGIMDEYERTHPKPTAAAQS